MIVTLLSGQSAPPSAICRDGMNEYHSLISMRTAAQRPALAEEREKNVAKVAAKVRKTMETTEFASFKMRNEYFWTVEGSQESLKPFHQWRLQEHHELDVISSGKQVVAHFFVEGKPLYDYFYNDGKVREYKHPWSGRNGQVAAYESDGYLHLRDGVDPRLPLDCEIAAFLTPYVGKNSTMAEPWENSIRTGLWLANVQGPHGENCELVCVTVGSDEENGQWDYYLVDDRGWIVQKYRIRAVSKMMRSLSSGQSYNRIIWKMTFDNFSTTVSAPQSFEPSRTLRELSKDWKNMSDVVRDEIRKEGKSPDPDGGSGSSPSSKEGSVVGRP